MRKFTWDEWTEFMEDNHNVLIPETIEFQPETIEFRMEGSKNKWAQKRTRDATLDELATAVINLDDEIKRLNQIRDELMAVQNLDDEIKHLNQIRDGLMAVQTRARRTLRAGSTSVHDALINPYAPVFSDDF